jgi:NTE family protein
MGDNRIWKRSILLITCIVVVWLAGTAWSAQASDSAEEKRPRIGLVLSGGGARGAAHIGVIKVLEQMHIPVDFIVGTSMGSIVGGLYASGMTISEIEKVLTHVDWTQALLDDISREDRSFRRKTDDDNYLVKSKPGLSDDFEIKLPSGLMQGQNIDLLLKDLVLPVSRVNDFDDLRIPYRAVATDIVTGKPVILGSGDLAMAMRASMSIPAVFATIEIDGKLLVDGGVSNNLPIDVVRGMGADIVIAVDISTPLLQREQLSSTLDITGQLTGILTRRNTEEQIATLTANDVFIVPDLGDITTASFDRAGEAIPIGAKAAEQKKQVLSKLSVSKTAYSDYQASQKVNLSKRKPLPPVIDFIRLDNRSTLSDEVFLARIEVKKGSVLDVAKLEENIRKIYGLELFENVSYDIINENGKTGLVIDIKARSWGPNYIQTGLTMGGDQDGDNFYNLAFAYTRTAINRLNGEWRSAIQLGSSPGIFTEIYQPLDFNSRYFIHPRLLYNQYTVNVYSDGNKLSEYRVTQYGADLALGRELGTWGEFRIGLNRMKGDAELTVGKPIWADYDFNQGEIYAKLSADTLDNLYFPSKGFSGQLSYISSQEELGADSEFEQMGLDVNLAKSWGRNTLIAGARIFSTLDDNAPLQNRFKLGGLFNLSGFNDEQLSGNQLGLLRLMYLRKINNFSFLPAYFGLTMESGNVWEEKGDMSLGSSIFASSIFLGLDTLLGPVYFGYGQAEGNNHAFYFYLGKIPF